MKASDWRNVPESGDLKCPKCKTWKQHWKYLCGLDSIEADMKKCSVYDCNNDATDGAHIENKHNGISDIYIAPMCNSCNHPDNKEMFTLKDKTIIVLADSAASCQATRPSKSLRAQITTTANDEFKAKNGTRHGGGFFY